MLLRQSTPALLALAALGGCAAPATRILSPAAAQQRLEARSLRDPALQQFLSSHGHPADGEWDLDRLTLTAFHFRPELDAARARVAEAEAGIHTAGDLPNPTFTFRPGRNSDAAPGISPWILGYALDLSLELAGRRTYRTAEARHRADAARAGLAATAWGVRRAVRQALTDTHAAEAAALLARELTPLLAQAAQLVEAQARAGEVSPLEATQARTTLQRAELAARENDRALASARSRLAESLGLTLSALDGVRLSYRGLDEPASPLTALDARNWAAQNHADLLAGLAAYAAAQSAFQAEVVRNYANLALGPGYTLDQGEGKWSLALGVTLPIFHRNQGPIAAAQARRDTAAAQFLAQQNRVLAEVERAHADYTSAVADLPTAQTLRANLERQAALAAARQAAGETSRLDLVRTRIELAEQSRTELAVRLRVVQARGAFEDAVQRPLAWPDTAWRSSSRTADAP